MAKLFNRAWMTISGTPGTGTVTLLAAKSAAYCTFAEAGVVNGDSVSYVIEDGDDIEIGVGTYTSSGTTLSRDTVRLSKEGATVGTAKINVGAGATVFIAPAKEDLWHTQNLVAPAKLDTEDQTVTGGGRITSKDLGTVTTGTLTPDPGDRPMQHYINGGAHTLAPGSNGGSYLLDITNNASAGAITTTGFTKKTGDAFTTTNGHKFRCFVSVGNTGSLLHVQAMQ